MLLVVAGVLWGAPLAGTLLAAAAHALSPRCRGAIDRALFGAPTAPEIADRIRPELLAPEPSTNRRLDRVEFLAHEPAL